MGPALIEPDHCTWRCWARRCRCCRNGAGSHRAGSPDQQPAHRPATVQAAMGPALIEPDHHRETETGGQADAAAMGPALIEPDHYVGLGSAPKRLTGRNGAGSHRAGSPVYIGIPYVPAVAAMGPALIEPDHLAAEVSRRVGADAPQWGRLSSSRITSAWGSTCPVRGAPQWGRLSSSRITP